MIEVCNCGWGHRTRLGEKLVCSRVPPAPVYKGARRRPAGPRARPQVGFLLGILFLVGFQQGKRGGRNQRERGRRKGGRSPSPCTIRTAHGGATPCGLPSLSPMAHVGPLLSPGVPVTPRYSDKYLKQSETIPVSEYYHPIYESLPLDHFETPRHVRDLIWDSEQTSVTKTHNS